MSAHVSFTVKESAGPGWEPRAGDGRSQWARSALRFALGQVVATPGALAAFKESDDSPLPYLARHAAGDWGDLDAEDRAANQRALITGERILSAYVLESGERVWIITEADRSATTFLLPSEY